jgi:Rrf2 family transcriptional regulator, nitric oxide-sensitive transcriptional repressor
MSNVLKISEAANLAMHAMVMMAAFPEKKHMTKEIAGFHNISEAHLSKVLQRLARAGLVKSVRGPKGGFFLAKESNEITLLEVYEAIEGQIGGNDCLLGDRVCKLDNCILGNVVGDINEQVKQYLSSHTLDLLTKTYTEQ